MRRWSFLAVALAASGCAAPSTTLVTDDGRRAHCASAGFGVIGTAIALGSYQNCVNSYEARGYRMPGAGSTPAPGAAVPGDHRAANPALMTQGRLRWLLPSGWVAATPPAALAAARFYAREPVLNGGATVVSIPRSDVQDLRTHVERIRSASGAQLAEGNVTPVQSLVVTGRPALRFEASGTADGLRLHYLFTFIEGTEELLKVTAWLPESHFVEGRSRIEALSEGLTETPAPLNRT